MNAQRVRATDFVGYARRILCAPQRKKTRRFCETNSVCFARLTLFTPSSKKKTIKLIGEDDEVWTTVI